LLASALDLKAEDEVVLTNIDFPAGATPWLTSRVKPDVVLWKQRDGALEVADLEPLLSARTRLVQVSLVSFYNGARVAWTSVVQAVRRLAPQAIIAVDVTQALGRVPLDMRDADIVISSTHKWTLGIHGSCVVGIPARNAARLTTTAGGWYHIENAFNDDRFQRAQLKTGALSYSVGMPSFAPIYALNASLRNDGDVDATGLFDILELAEVGRSARCAVTNDSGPMHVLAAANIPVYALFGPSDWRRNHALGQADRVFACVDYDTRHAGAACADCLAAVSAEIVFARLLADGVLNVKAHGGEG
jgi:hypothetical protein